jgi:phosphatidylinositol 3-kinase
VTRSRSYEIFIPVFPVLSPDDVCSISRKQHIFAWPDGPNDRIDLPITYAELPEDAELSVKFYPCLLGRPSRPVATATVPLFQQNLELQHGVFLLTFDRSSETAIQKAVRANATNALTRALDGRFATVSELLHPSDATIFFRNLLNPTSPAPLSDVSQFAKIELFSPDEYPRAVVLYGDSDIAGLPGSDSAFPFALSESLYEGAGFADGPRKTSHNEANAVARLNKLRLFPPLSELVVRDRELVLRRWESCLDDVDLLPLLLRYCDWRVEQRLDKRPIIPVDHVLEFFTDRYTHPSVRRYALRCLKSATADSVFPCIPQILQIYKIEPSLADFLIRHATQDVFFATRLHWAANLTCPELLPRLREALPAPVRDDIQSQVEFVETIRQLLTAPHQRPTKDKVKELVVELLRRDAALQNFARPVRLPFDPSVLVVGIDPDQVKVFESKWKPVVLSFKLPDGGRYKVIWKLDDDMQQDQLIIQLFEIMSRIFEANKLDLPVTAYATMAFSSGFGCCRCVDDSDAIAEVFKLPNKLFSYLITGRAAEDEAKVKRFKGSLAAYSVMTYVLAVGDRHDNNILVTKDGRIVHIDFGFILGDDPKAFVPPLKLTRDMMVMIDQNEDKSLNDLIALAWPAFSALRKKARLILALIELMMNAPIACFANEKKRQQKLEIVQTRLRLDQPDGQAKGTLQCDFRRAITSIAQSLVETAHSIAMAAKGSASTPN